jgi:hypothetical protein
MSVDVTKFKEALGLRNNSRTGVPANRPLRIVELSPKTRDFLQMHGVPPSIVAFLAEHAFDHHLTIGKHTFYAVDSLPDENLDDAQRRCIESGLLIIGSALNGDPIVVDLRSETVGFVFHDELWEDEDVTPKSILTDTGLDIGSFYLAAARYSDSFPRDGRDAAEVGSDFVGRFPL